MNNKAYLTLQIGDPGLKLKNKIITDFKSAKVRNIISDLKDTMYNKGLIGIAAPQIGENYRIFITEPRETKARTADQSDRLRVYINPVIVRKSKQKTLIYEGCGSVLDGQLFGPVHRASWVVVRARDQYGQEFEFKANGILGRVIQHEFDHLAGIEFIEKVSDYKKLLSYEHYAKQIKFSKWHIQNSKITIKEYKYILKSPLRRLTLCFLLKDNEILLAIKKRGFGEGNWNGVGGKVELGEKIRQAAVREAQEEINVTPAKLQLSAVLNFYFPHKPEWNEQVNVYISRKWKGVPSETEEMKPRWFKIDNLPLENMWSSDKHWLPQVLSGEKLKGEFTFTEDNIVSDFKIRTIKSLN